MSLETTIELAVRPSVSHEAQDRQDSPVIEGDGLGGVDILALPPVDSGWAAWSYLAAAFVIESVLWGLPDTFGLFLIEYLNDPKLSSQPGAAKLLPLIGPLSSSIMLGSGLFLYPFMSRYPHYRRPMSWVGCILTWASLFGAGYTRSVVGLLAFQGVLYGVGGSLLYGPCLAYLSEWFVSRRGMANGILFAGTSVGGLILPLTLPYLFRAYGVSKALRVFSGLIAATTLPALPFLRGRLPETRVHGSRRSHNIAWVRDSYFWALMAANVLQGFAFFVPIIWLPIFAKSLHLSDSKVSLALATLNGSAIIGRLLTGYLSDKYNASMLALANLICATFVTFILWGVTSTTFGGLIVFGLCYGAFVVGWASLWTSLSRPLAKDDPVLATTLLGLLLFGRGFGNILASPISTSLIDVEITNKSTHHPLTGFTVEGGRYAGMITFTGGCYAGAALIALTWSILQRSRI